jgi:hypothetical protein
MLRKISGINGPKEAPSDMLHIGEEFQNIGVTSQKRCSDEVTSIISQSSNGHLIKIYILSCWLRESRMVLVLAYK